MHLRPGMWRHSTAIVAVFFVMVAGFGIALAAGSTILAIMALLGGLVVGFVMAIAWMRPASGPIEHHPRSDRIVDDTAP